MRKVIRHVYRRICSREKVPCRLLLLGTTGYHPSERRHTACMMLPEIGVVLDAGTAMFRVRQHLATPTLDIFLTH